MLLRPWVSASVVTGWTGALESLSREFGGEGAGAGSRKVVQFPARRLGGVIRPMRTLAALILAVASGCGPQWEGRYTGPLTVTGTCSDGSGGTTSGTADWVLKETAAGLEIAANGSCGTFYADVSGSMATVRPKNCPSHTSSGVTWSNSLERGSVGLNENTISPNITFRATSGAGGNCTFINTGSLNRTR